MNPFKAIMPKEGRFFDLFALHAESIAAAAQVLTRLLAKKQGVADACREIAEHEHRADEVTRDVLNAVRRTFITPFDRSAIKDLTSSMDDAVDEMQKTAKAVTQFEVDAFEPEMVQMAELAELAAGLVLEAVPLLRSVGRNHEALHAIAERIVQIEEEADALHEAGVKVLFQRHREGSAMPFIVGREIYSHLEKVLDRFEDVANEISGIVIDHA